MPFKMQGNNENFHNHSIKSVGARIRIIRESKQFSQEYMARKLRMTQQAYSRIEQLTDNITLRKLRLLAETLEVPIHLLIGEESFQIQQNYDQENGNAGTNLFIKGLADSERMAYENHIADLRRQLSIMEQLLERSKQ
jgi:transcriptional regulator with XRE-family HTH domain